MNNDITDFFVHTVTVETFTGVGAGGPVYAAPVSVTGYLDETTRLLRKGDGSEIVSRGHFYCSIADLAKFTQDSRVTLPDRVSQVISSRSNDLVGQLPGVEHGLVFLK